MSNMLNCAEQVQGQNVKHMHIRGPKQHVSKQSSSNIQLSSKDGLKKRQIIYVPIKRKNGINAHAVIPALVFRMFALYVSCGLLTDVCVGDVYSYRYR